MTLWYCLSEYFGSAVHIWNSHTKQRAVGWKTKEADFLPWKAEIPLSCDKEQRQCPAPLPEHHRGLGNGSREGPQPPPVTVSSPCPMAAAALRGCAGECSLEHPPALDPAPLLPQRKCLPVDSSCGVKHTKTAKQLLRGSLRPLSHREEYSHCVAI